MIQICRRLLRGHNAPPIGIDESQYQVVVNRNGAIRFGVLQRRRRRVSECMAFQTFLIIENYDAHPSTLDIEVSERDRQTERYDRSRTLPLPLVDDFMCRSERF